jgi:cytochrome c-type biogenesis protein CcmH/NrfF
LNKRFPSFLRGLLVAIFLVGASGMQAGDDRAEKLGEGLICMCSCNQLLSGCEMIACPSKGPMRKELQQYIDEGEDDKTILASFAAKFGPKVLSAPVTTDWFNLSAWIMPFAVLAAGSLAVIFAVKRRQTAGAPVEATAPPISKYEAEIEEELRKFTPED